jgi:hypothetical protein
VTAFNLLDGLLEWCIFRATSTLLLHQEIKSCEVDGFSSRGPSLEEFVAENCRSNNEKSHHPHSDTIRRFVLNYRIGVPGWMAVIIWTHFDAGIVRSWNNLALLDRNSRIQ